jgi:hypothetical protein
VTALTPPAGDKGDAEPTLVAALDAGDLPGVREALLHARLLVPVVASGEESTAVDMAVPRLIGADGRHALPVFSCYEAMRAWRAQARPVPMSGEQAMAAAVSEGYEAIILDVAGPVPYVLEIDRPG